LQHELPQGHVEVPHLSVAHWQLPLLHSGAVSGQTFPHVPQLLASVSRLVQVPEPQSTLPVGHWHVPVVQTYVAGHAVHEGPQCVASDCVLNWHALPVPLQSLYPALQVVPQLPWLHVAVPFAGTGQGVQLEPQCVGSPSVS
jgi:hypothetical protein